jgi:hypothetical protein
MNLLVRQQAQGLRHAHRGAAVVQPGATLAHPGRVLRLTVTGIPERFDPDTAERIRPLRQRVLVRVDDIPSH